MSADYEVKIEEDEAIFRFEITCLSNDRTVKFDIGTNTLVSKLLVGSELNKLLEPSDRIKAAFTM